jgi:hypothetical protein
MDYITFDFALFCTLKLSLHCHWLTQPRLCSHGPGEHFTLQLLQPADQHLETGLDLNNKFNTAVKIANTNFCVYRFIFVSVSMHCHICQRALNAPQPPAMTTSNIQKQLCCCLALQSRCRCYRTWVLCQTRTIEIYLSRVRGATMRLL